MIKSSKYGNLKRGDVNPTTNKMFFGYHKSGKEMWLAKERFEEAELNRKMNS